MSAEGSCGRHEGLFAIHVGPNPLRRSEVLYKGGGMVVAVAPSKDGLESDVAL